MAKKIICESCGTIFEYNIAKEFENCPVCGASFEEEEENMELEEEESEDAVMYFDQIMIFKEDPEYNSVRVYCGECGTGNAKEIIFFDELVDKEYVTLKKDVVLKCRGCGREHKPRKIKYRLKDEYIQLPHCPVCNSVMLKKITRGRKIIAAAALGAFAVPYTSKTYECGNCGHLF